MAQPEKAIVRSLFDPQIQLDAMVIKDTDKNTGHNDPKDSTYKISGDIGVRFPFIKINGYVFEAEEIANMEISTVGFVPTIRLSCIIRSGAFAGQGVPKDGDIISIMLRSKNDALKPIRNDYLITSVDTDGGNTNAQAKEFMFSGRLFIPGMYDEDIRSFEGTSFETLQKIATDLKLGFATNESATADEQVWICPSESYEQWMMHISNSMWKDDTSYFKIFIDIYYHLNVINVNNQFSDGFEIDLAVTDMLFKPAARQPSPDGELADTQQNVAKVFNNIEQFRSSSFYISNFEIKNNSANIAKTNGYMTAVTFFDMSSLQPWELMIDPVNTEGSGRNKLILKGRMNPLGDRPNADFWKTQIKKRYIGIQYSKPEHNVHDKYLYSKLFNDRNLKELDKLYIQIDVEGINFNVYRGERIPVFFMNQDDNAQQEFNREDGVELDATDKDPTPNQFYNGYYMLDGAKIKYDDERRDVPYLHTVYDLRRREWPAP
jgi:hypothetical protein